MRLFDWRELGKILKYHQAVAHLEARCREPKSVIAIVALLLVVLLVMWNRAKIFTLDVSTEVVQFSVSDPLLSEWMIGNARLIDNAFSEDEEGTVLDDHSILLLNVGTQVRIQRHGIEHTRLLLTTDNKASTGRIEDAEGRSIELRDWALLLVAVSDRPLVFPFRGTLTVGDDVAIGVNSILLSGTVSVVEEQMVGKTHYTAGIEDLDPGDRIQFLRHDHTPVGTRILVPAIVDGFIRVEPAEGFSGPANALMLVAHGQADFVQVDRLGSAGYQVNAPRWARFLHDPLLAAATAIIGLLAMLLAFSSKCIEILERRQEHDKISAEADDQASNEKAGTLE